MKNVMKLGKALSKMEQKTINGGKFSLCDLPSCASEGDACCYAVGQNGVCTPNGGGGFYCAV